MNIDWTRKLYEDIRRSPDPKYNIGDKFVDKILGKENSHSYFIITQIYLSELVEDVFLYDLKIKNMDGTFCGTTWHRISEEEIDNKMIKLEE